MKAGDFFKIENDRIIFVKSGREAALQDVKSTEVVIRPVLKEAGSTVANALANAVTNSIANGNEHINVIARVPLFEGYEDILMNDQILIRGNDAYYEMIKHARNLQKKLKQHIG